MLRFASLGSGSKGNATIIESATTRLLIDCGFAARELNTRLMSLCDQDGSSLSAVLVTHEHGDHSKGVGALARKHDLTVWASAGTFRHSKFGELPHFNLIEPNQASFMIGDIEITPFPVPHDAHETVQFIFRNGDHCLGILTDVGMITPHIISLFQACNAVLLEANHDLDMLARGPYPASLQRRVGGDYGHLNNQQAASFLGYLDANKIQQLVIAHLSEKNNQEQLARQCLVNAMPSMENKMTILRQDKISPWFEWAI